MKKTLYLFLILLMTAALITSCGDQKKGEDPKPDPKPVVPQNILLSSEDGAYQFTAPDTWNTTPGGLVKKAELEIENSSQAAFVVALVEEDAANSLNLQDYSNRVLKKMRTSEDLLDTELISTSSAMVAGKEAVRAELTGTVDSIRIHYWIYTLVNGTDLIQLDGWCLDAAAKAYQTEIPTILESFSINVTSGGETDSTE